jgi:hypothetical protein
VRIKIIENQRFKKTAKRKFPLKIFLFFLSFSLYFVLALVPVFCVQEDALRQEAIVLESKQEAMLIKEILLQQKRNQKIAVQKAFAEANKQMVLGEESQFKQARAQKIIEKKIYAENKKQAALNKKARLQKEGEEKLAQNKERNDSEPSKGASDYIIIKVRPLSEILEQAGQLLKNGKYEDALATYNYAYDIAKDKAEKKNILKKKSDLKGFIANWKRKRVIAEKKNLQEVEQPTAYARKAWFQKERELRNWLKRNPLSNLGKKPD